MQSRKDEIKQEISQLRRQVGLKSIGFFISWAMLLGNLFWLSDTIYGGAQGGLEAGTLVFCMIAMIVLLPASIRVNRDEIKVLENERAFIEANSEGELQYTVDTSGLDADEWHFSGGRKKKKKREELEEDWEYIEEENYSELSDEG